LQLIVKEKGGAWAGRQRGRASRSQKEKAGQLSPALEGVRSKATTCYRSSDFMPGWFDAWGAAGIGGIGSGGFETVPV
jgi:hypothetical protein